MNKYKFLTRSLVLMLLFTNLAHAAVSIGVQAPRGALKAMAEWSELGKYLTKELGQEVKILPVDVTKTVKTYTNGGVDYMLANPVMALTLIKKQNAKTLVTLNRKAGNQLGGVIIAKKGSNIKTSTDLKGKSVLAFKFKKSAAGYVFQVKHVMDKGLDPFKDFSSFTQAKNQDDIVFAVKNGLADAGFVKTGLLEAMQKEGKIKKTDFEIVDQVNDGFAHVHSTKMYPQWTIVYGDKTDPVVTAKLKTALLKLKSDDMASKKARIAGFVEPLSFDELDKTMRALKLGPYNE